MRYSYDGMFDRAACGGPVTGSGPGWDTALAKYTKRAIDRGQRGKWNSGISKTRKTWKTNKGQATDPNWCIINW